MQINWKSPDYGPVLTQRRDRLLRLRAEPELVPGLWEYYRTNPVAFITDWGCTSDPRNVEVGLPASVPFVLFPKQEEYIGWIYDRWKGREKGLVYKSRDMGVSWCCVAFAVWMWIFYPGVVIGFGSRKEEYVDKLGAPKALFWKVREFIKLLPAEFRPKDWDGPFMRILNNDNGSAIVGEAGNSIGRGDRTSCYFVDEAQPLGSGVLTPFGWRTMGEIDVGDEVIGSDGRATRVLGINEAGEHAVYRFKFSDGTEVECSPNHKWTVDAVIGPKKRVTLRAQEIAENYAYRSPGGQTLYRYRLPVLGGVEFGDASTLPVDPYILGVLLGDGCLSKNSPEITSADPEIIDMVRARLPDGYLINKMSHCDIQYRIVREYGRKGKHGGALKDGLTHLKLLGCRSWEKFIPDVYLLSSKDARTDLLRGLMDTDGSASNGACTFHSCSKALADGVAFLARSLGGMVTQTVKPDHRGYKDIHYVYISMPESFSPFYLKRKTDKIQKRKHDFRKTIIGVDILLSEPVKCITVDNKDGLYVTDGFCLTHNSAHLENQESVDAALSATTNCRIDVSTPVSMGGLFERKVFAGKLPLFTFEWRSDPRKDDEWYKKQCEELDPIVLAQEVDLNPMMSIQNVLLDGAKVAVAMSTEVIAVEGSGPWMIGVDAAHEGNDASVIHSRRGRFNMPQIVIKGATQGNQIAGAVEQQCKTLEAAGGEIGQIVIELDGPGTSVYDFLKLGPYRDKVRGIHTGARQKDERNYNLRAKLWNLAKEYFDEGGVYMPVDMDLRQQLSSVLYQFKDGLYLIMSKKDYKKQFKRSPDNADAFILTFNPYQPKMYSRDNDPFRAYQNSNVGWMAY